MIREEFAEFVELWNNHHVRPQKNRPHVIPGKPWDLYESDTVRNWGIPIPDSSRESEILRTMDEPLKDINIDDFLTLETEAWGDNYLQTIGFDWTLRTADYTDFRPHLEVYLQLRQDIRQHIDENRTPQLQLIEAPRGGVSEYVRIK